MRQIFHQLVLKMILQLPILVQRKLCMGKIPYVLHGSFRIKMCQPFNTIIYLKVMLHLNMCCFQSMVEQWWNHRMCCLCTFRSLIRCCSGPFLQVLMSQKCTTFIDCFALAVMNGLAWRIIKDICLFRTPGHKDITLQGSKKMSPELGFKIISGVSP